MKKIKVKSFFQTLGLLVLILVCLTSFITFLNRGRFPSLEKLNGLNQIGDALGGMSSPLIGIFSALLVYYSFREQLRANQLLMATNSENYIKDNLKEYLERIEKKYERITDNGNFNLKINFDSIIKYYNTIAVLDNKIIDTDVKLTTSEEYNRSLADDALTEENELISDVSDLIRSCESYSKYIRNKLAFRLSDEIVELIEIYHDDYWDLFTNKIMKNIKFEQIIIHKNASIELTSERTQIETARMMIDWSFQTNIEILRIIRSVQESILMSNMNWKERRAFKKSRKKYQ